MEVRQLSTPEVNERFFLMGKYVMLYIKVTKQLH